MLVASIDLEGGQAVQLRQGEELAVAGGDPFIWADRFSVNGDLAVIDLDAAKGRPLTNRGLVEELIGYGRVRVGGGVRSVDTARHWLERGADKVIVGTAATPQFLGQLNEDLDSSRIMAAMDAYNGEVVINGWRKRTGKPLIPSIQSVAAEVGGFLITCVEKEGVYGGVDFDFARGLKGAAGEARVTLAGGIRSAEEVASLDFLGMDSQVGMALYENKMSLPQVQVALLGKQMEEQKRWPVEIWQQGLQIDRGQITEARLDFIMNRGRQQIDASDGLFDLVGAEPRQPWCGRLMHIEPKRNQGFRLEIAGRSKPTVAWPEAAWRGSDRHQQKPKS